MGIHFPNGLPQRRVAKRRVSQLIREWEHVSSIRFLSRRRRKPKEDKAECTVGLLAGEFIEIPGSRVEEEKKESERKKGKKGKERRRRNDSEEVSAWKETLPSATRNLTREFLFRARTSFIRASFPILR